MADHEDEKNSGLESDDEDRDSDSDSEVESEKPAKVEPKRGAKARVAAAPVTASNRHTATIPKSSVGVLVAFALLGGAALGWFGHIEQAKATLRADSRAVPVSSGAPAGPCGVWQQQVCNGAGGDKSAACAQAKGAAELLTPSACEAAIASLSVTLSKLKTARASCDKLVTQLCGDLKPGSPTCTMVRERTPSFPAQRCQEMLAHYADVIGELKRMDEGGGMLMGGPGGPHAGSVPSASPH